MCDSLTRFYRKRRRQSNRDVAQEVQRTEALSKATNQAGCSSSSESDSGEIFLCLSFLNLNQIFTKCSYYFMRQNRALIKIVSVKF
jgi:hypothetical protein